ncbi:AAA family ATPase [Microbacterium flavum]|uniref:AAA family ATPase n=1 Tax=Microbacterium flavum TaxID=415216 RepID=UPI0024ACB977|nr:AAA family ATPase [Microbacterium flavum]
MRGGLERWKRGVESHGVRSAIAYALEGTCDASMRLSSGVEALAAYSETEQRTVTRFAVEDGAIDTDQLSKGQLCQWVDGFDPLTGEHRGRVLSSPQADLLLDGTINAPKSFSLVALIHPELAAEFEALQDRLRDRVIRIWQRELNARRGAGGKIRENIRRLEAVELQHRRSRALDPHIHRHLWLSVKVQGEDGAWSNVDSRVAMKLHTLINAEGELAACTDPQWVEALARRGYTINDDGEVAEVAAAVRPLSRRSNQIEANRAMKLAAWRADHPGQEPDRDIIRQIDRFAWSKDRPTKPQRLDEDEWEQLVRDEIAAIDPALLSEVAPRPVVATAPADPDPDLFAAKALVDADRRSAASGGRFSLIDVRAGATRAVASSGIVASREDLAPLIDDVVARALSEVVDVLSVDPRRPQHVKAFMTPQTALLKLELAERFDRLNIAGINISDDVLARVAATTLPGVGLDPGQIEAAAAIAGTNRLVAVTGPAGAGKTTMLRLANEALRLQHRRMIVVAPTKKAASVAAREIGANASSLHALLADHGWRWDYDEAGREMWTRLRVGEVDAAGIAYLGPRRYPIEVDDRIVVDEAGMVDLNTARALAELAEETGAQVAMVGDHLQAMPVGHSGAMACMARRSGAVVEMSAVHRFRDAEYAALTLRMRDPVSQDAALEVAEELAQRGQVHAVTDQRIARDLMLHAYFAAASARQRIALVVATNDEADAINDEIQQRRVDRGDLDLRAIAVGMDEQRILIGDIVQTRLNDTVAGVENRAVWVVRDITAEGVELASTTDSADIRLVGVDYTAEHVHLSYASTVHGIQGETTDVSMVGPGVDAAGLYVGMTRGRLRNDAIALVKPHQTAAGVIADAMMRGLPEVTIEDSRAAAHAELARAARDPDSSEQDTDGQIDRLIAEATATLQGIDSRIASRSATTHGRGTADATLGDELEREVRMDLEARAAAAERLGALLVTSAPSHARSHLDGEDQWMPAASQARPTASLGR